MEKMEIIYNDILELLESEARTLDNLTTTFYKALGNDETVPDDYYGTAEYIRNLAIEIHLGFEPIKRILKNITIENRPRILEDIKERLQVMERIASNLFSFVKILQIASTGEDDKIIIEYLEFMDGIKKQAKALRSGINEYIEELTSKIWESEENEKAEN